MAGLEPVGVGIQLTIAANVNDVLEGMFMVDE